MSKRLYPDEKMPFPMFGLEMGDGWKPIAMKVVNAIHKYNDNSPEDSVIYIDQVKEKFATMRIYVTYDNVPQDVVNKIENLIKEAEVEASETCELCGTKKNVGIRLNGWYTVMCEKCAKNVVKENFVYARTGIKWKRKKDDKIFFISESGVTDYEEFEKLMKDGK